MKKGSVVWSEFLPWIVALVVAGIVIATYLILSDTGGNVIASIKNFLRLN